MLGNTVLWLTLQLLASLTYCIVESQILQNRQPWSYSKNEHLPRTEVSKQNPVFLQSSHKTPVQSAPWNTKCTTNLNENQQIVWDQLLANPTTFNNNPNNYENIIRKYDSMVNSPNIASNYYVPEQPKGIENKFNKNCPYKRNLNSKKSEKSRRRNENLARNNKQKEKKHRKYRQSEEGKYNLKKKDNKPLEVYNDTSKKFENMDVSFDKEEIEALKEIEKTFLNIERVNKTATSHKTTTEANKHQSEDDKKISFDCSIRTAKENNKKRSTVNSKTTPTMEYQTKYFNQDEFNRYLQNIMAGNLSNPYYFANDMYPYLFDSFYKEYSKSKNKNSNKRKNVKSRNKTRNKSKEEDCDTVIELSPNFHEATPVTITTGTGPKKDIYLNLKIKNKDLVTHLDTNIKTPETINEEHIQVDSDEEFDRKPFIINLFNPTEDDVEYYPDFTLSNHAYLTSSEEEELEQIQKHHEHFKNDWDYYADKVKSYVDQSSKKSNMKPEVVTFDVNTNVETIYAPSRVISYSQTEKQTENVEKKEENFSFKEGDTTIVLSRSIS